jgi:hypothetical protein
MPMNKKPQRSKSPMKTGLLSRRVPAPKEEIFNFLKAQEPRDVRHGSVESDFPDLDARVGAERKL